MDTPPILLLAECPTCACTVYRTWTPDSTATLTGGGQFDPDRHFTTGHFSPETAQCPACGAPVRRRKRRVHNGRPTYFYRHEPGSGEGCPLRYSPGEEGVLRCESRLLVRGLQPSDAEKPRRKRQP